MINGATDAQGTGHRGRFFVGATTVGACVGTGYGIIIDAMVHKTIYERPRATVRIAPLLKPNTVAASVTLAWARGR